MISVAFDARKHADYGIGTYVRRLLVGFAQRPSEVRCTVFTGRDEGPLDPVPPGWTKEQVSYKAYGLGEFLLYGRRIRQTGCQLFHAPHYTTPLTVGLPSIVTVHDLIHLRFPAYYGVHQRAYARLMVGHAARVSRLLLTDSEATKRDLIERIGTPEGKIRVVPLGVDEDFFPADDSTVKAMREALDLPSRFVIFLGNPKPHKGIDILIKAFQHTALKEKDLSLVVVGGSEGDTTSIQRMVEQAGLNRSVRHLRRLPVGQLPALITAARMLVMPSRWEGFGLPVLEAMACGTPVISTTAGSLPEVAGSAAVMVRPEDPGELADAILAVERDNDLRLRLRTEGLARSRTFRWERTVQETISAYRSIL